MLISFDLMNFEFKNEITERKFVRKKSLINSQLFTVKGTLKSVS